MMPCTVARFTVPLGQKTTSYLTLYIIMLYEVGSLHYIRHSFCTLGVCLISLDYRTQHCHVFMYVVNWHDLPSTLLAWRWHLKTFTILLIVHGGKNKLSSRHVSRQVCTLKKNYYSNSKNEHFQASENALIYEGQHISPSFHLCVFLSLPC